MAWQYKSVWQSTDGLRAWKMAESRRGAEFQRPAGFEHMSPDSLPLDFTTEPQVRIDLLEKRDINRHISHF